MNQRLQHWIDNAINHNSLTIIHFQKKLESIKKPTKIWVFTVFLNKTQKPNPAHKKIGFFSSLINMFWKFCNSNIQNTQHQNNKAPRAKILIQNLQEPVASSPNDKVLKSHSYVTLH